MHERVAIARLDQQHQIREVSAQAEYAFDPGCTNVVVNLMQVPLVQDAPAAGFDGAVVGT